MVGNRTRNPGQVKYPEGSTPSSSAKHPEPDGEAADCNSAVAGSIPVGCSRRPIPGWLGVRLLTGTL